LPHCLISSAALIAANNLRTTAKGKKSAGSGSAPSTVRLFFFIVSFSHLFSHFQGKRPRLDPEDLESDEDVEIILEDPTTDAMVSSDMKEHVPDISRKVCLSIILILRILINF
jgi:hypothetical protein